MDPSTLNIVLICVVSVPWFLVALVAKYVKEYVASIEPVTLLRVVGDEVFEREWLTKPVGTHPDLPSPIINHLSTPLVKAAHDTRRKYMQACIAQLQFDVGAVRIGDDRHVLQVAVAREFLTQAAFAMSLTDLMGIREKLLNDMKTDAFLQWKNPPPRRVLDHVVLPDAVGAL